MNRFALGLGSVTANASSQLWLQYAAANTLSNSISGAGNLIVNTTGSLTVDNTASINISGGIYFGYNSPSGLIVNNGTRNVNHS